MDERLHSLTEREKETLRLLLGGHDAKSAAREMGLSVHTVNERLREARRKLGVTSSREAARLLAQHEPDRRNFLGDMELGVAAGGPDQGHLSSHQRRGAGRTRAGLIGGMVIMVSILAAAALAAVLLTDGGGPSAAGSRATSERVASADRAGVNTAQAWAELLDKQQWAESWTQSGRMFQSGIDQAGWASTIRPLRQQLGAVSSRAVESVKNASSLPGAPDGEYKIVQFTTDFANKRGAIETVVMAREGSAWKVNGYFIR